jgi:hypothetical protein
MAETDARRERLTKLLDQLKTMTESGELHWDRQQGSAHRYARWKDNLLILGPAEAPGESKVPRYLFVTPFNSPACVEINSNDPELGDSLLQLVTTVEGASSAEAPTDPFALSEEELDRLVS